MWMIKQMTPFLLILQSNLSVLKEQSRNELSSHIPGGILTLHWQQCSAIFACPSVAQLCVSGTSSRVVVGVGLLPRHFEVTFFRWVNQNFLYHHSRFFGQQCSGTVGRCRYVSSGNYKLSHSFHTQCLSIHWALSVCAVMRVWSYLRFSVQ